MTKFIPVIGVLLVLLLVTGIFYSLDSIETDALEKDADMRSIEELDLQQAVVVLEPKVSSVVLPIAEYTNRRNANAFGERNQFARFRGFHVADDIEYTEVKEEIPVVAIADGIVRRVDWVSGYGGVIVITHTIEDALYTAIYGHIDLASTLLKTGDRVQKEQYIAVLGEGGTYETDGTRKHLHFSIYEGNDDGRIQGYEVSGGGLGKWINPYDFFSSKQIDMQGLSRTYDPNSDFGGQDFQLEFLVPAGWEVEFIGSGNFLNLYSMQGEGSSLDRSQIVITRSPSMPSSGIVIHSAEVVSIGAEQQYTAWIYSIEDKEKSFIGHPVWRQKRHSIVDFRDKDDQEYYRIGKNPELEQEIFWQILDSIEIIE